LRVTPKSDAGCPHFGRATRSTGWADHTRSDKFCVATGATDWHDSAQWNAVLGDNNFFARPNMVESRSGCSAEFRQRDLHTHMIVSIRSNQQVCTQTNCLSWEVGSTGDDSPNSFGRKVCAQSISLASDKPA
jgi:hypothetical protein